MADLVCRMIDDDTNQTTIGITINEIWLVDYNDGVYHHSAEALNETGVPDYDQAHDVITNAIVSNKSVERHTDEGGNEQLDAFLVSITYTWEAPQSAEDPTQDPPVYSWDNATQDELVDRDADDDEFKNTTGDSYEGITLDRSKMVIVVTMNQMNYDPLAADDMSGSVNSDPFFIKGTSFPAKTLKCTQYAATTATYFDALGIEIEYFQATYRFLVNRKKPWNPLEIRDRGKRILVGGKPVPITEEGIEVSDDRDLDGAGNLLPIGDPVVYNQFKGYPENSFAAAAF